MKCQGGAGMRIGLRETSSEESVILCIFNED